MESAARLADMKTRNLQLWYAHPGDLIDPTVAEACADLLSEQEQERWQRQKEDELQRRLTRAKDYRDHFPTR